MCMLLIAYEIFSVLAYTKVLIRPWKGDGVALRRSEEVQFRLGGFTVYLRAVNERYLKFSKT